MAHVQRAGDVGRRQQDAEVLVRRLAAVYAGSEVISGFPLGVPAAFNIGWFESFGEFHVLGLKRKTANYTGFKRHLRRSFT